MMCGLILALLFASLLLPTSASAGVLFDSTSDRLTATTFTLPTTGTICLNVYPNNAQTDGAFHLYCDIRNAGTPNAFHLLDVSDNSLTAGWFTSSIDYRVAVTSANYALTQRAWNTFCLTWDDTANENEALSQRVADRVYRDLARDVVHGGRDLASRNARSDVSSIDARARIAKVAMWNRVVAGIERTNRMNGRLASCISSGLVNYWKLQTTTI